MQLQYGTYSVISPEGCASILYKSAERASDAAEALGITAPRLLELGLIDEVVPEPCGGAHRDIPQMTQTLKASIKRALVKKMNRPIDELLKHRYDRLMSYGQFLEE